MEALKMTRIDAAWLRAHNACEEQVVIFEAEWPDGADITAENILRAVELELDFDWLAPHVLSASGYAAYEEARAQEYLAWRRVYEKALVQAKAARNNVMKMSEVAFEEVIGVADVAYEKALAQAFIEMLPVREA